MKSLIVVFVLSVLAGAGVLLGFGARFSGGGHREEGHEKEGDGHVHGKCGSGKG